MVASAGRAAGDTILLIVPNEPAQLLTLEADGSRRDFRRLIEEAGYRLTAPTSDQRSRRERTRAHTRRLLPVHSSP